MKALLVWVEWNNFPHLLLKNGIILHANLPHLTRETIFQGRLRIAWIDLSDYHVIEIVAVIYYSHIIYCCIMLPPCGVYIYGSWLLIYFMSIGFQWWILANLFRELSNMGWEGTIPGMWSSFHPISSWADIICSIPTFYKQVFHCPLFLTWRKKIP